MGIRGITMLLIKSALAAIRETNLSEYKGKTFVIDTSIFLYKALYNSGNHIDFIRKMVIRLLTNGIIPVFILGILFYFALFAGLISLWGPFYIETLGRRVRGWQAIISE